MIELNLGLGELSEVVKILPQSGVVILQGNLASGKTTNHTRFIYARGLDDFGQDAIVGQEVLTQSFAWQESIAGQQGGNVERWKGLH